MPPWQTPQTINSASQLSLPPTFSTTAAFMTFQIYLSPLELSLYSGQKSLPVLTATLVSRGTRWSSQSRGSSAVKMPYPSPPLHPHSQAMLEPAFQLLHFQEAVFSHRPSVRTLIMHSETPAVSSPPLSTTAAQGLQIQPELGHIPVRDHLPSLLLFLHWPKWRFHPVLSQPSLVLDFVLPITFLSPGSGIPANPL